MKVYICDDDIAEIKKLRLILGEYASLHKDISFEISTFSNSFDFLDDIYRKGSPDIALLDICMPGMLGTEIAREINSSHKNATDIIFLTTSSDYAVDAYTLRASDYIKKPYDKKRLFQTLDRITEARRQHSFKLIKCDKGIVRFDLYDLIYAETLHGKIIIHLKSGDILKSHMTLISFSELFNEAEGFSAVGASYLVNFRCIVHIDSDTIELSDGNVLSIPRRLKLDLKQQLFDFYKNQGKKNQ